MLERERLQACKLAVGEAACAAWVVILAPVAGYRPCLGVWVIGWPVQWTAASILDVVVWVMRGDFRDCVVDGAERGKESSGDGGVYLGVGRGVRWLWEGR